jgi:hypothetical protein
MVLGNIDVVLAVQGLSSVLMATVAWTREGERGEVRSGGGLATFGLASWIEILLASTLPRAARDKGFLSFLNLRVFAQVAPPA